ncbi:hypothetical protein EV363DRAFT_717399 [Boletus edulis]|nr:hypothetical protein EV363DRAFT_717399 [Boletus edulis]
MSRTEERELADGMRDCNQFSPSNHYYDGGVQPIDHLPGSAFLLMVGSQIYSDHRRKEENLSHRRAIDSDEPGELKVPMCLAPTVLVPDKSYSCPARSLLHDLDMRQKMDLKRSKRRDDHPFEPPFDSASSPGARPPISCSSCVFVSPRHKGESSR